MDASFTYILLCFAGCLSYGFLSKEEQRIIGGRRATIQQVPYIVSLRMDNRHICGASIISKDWVVTAAHCFHDDNGNIENNLVGRTILCSESSFYKNCTIHTVAKVIIHEKYNPNTQDYDIAVVQVKKPFTFNNSTRPICLPSSGASNAKNGTICGWGYYQKYANGTAKPVLSDQLQCTHVLLVNKTKCPRYFPRGSITSQMVCYGYVEGGRDTCQGDSGGPLVNARTLYGVTSWGRGCADKKSPGVYADVIKLVGWVTGKTGVNA